LSKLSGRDLRRHASLLCINPTLGPNLAGVLG